MRYYSEDLQRLQQEILEKKRTKAKLSDLQIQQAELKERTAKLEKLMAKGCRPAEPRKSVSFLLQSIRTNGRKAVKGRGGSLCCQSQV